MLLRLGPGFEDLRAAAVIATCGWTGYREHLPTVGPIKVSGRFISCSGPARALDVALPLLKHLIGAEAAVQVRRYLTGSELPSEMGGVR